MVLVLKINPITSKLDLVNEDSGGDVWEMNITPTGTVDGSNATFVLPEYASDVIVYADGMRAVASDYSLVDDTITFTTGRQPYSSISVDYLPA